VAPLDLLPYWDEAALDAVIPPQKGREAYVELHNLIAAAEDVRAYGPDDLVRIGRRHGVDLRRAFHTERLALYAAHLRYVLARGAFGEAERAALAHLARTLHLDEPALRLLHEEAFGRAVSQAISNDGLSVEERLLLYTLQHTLGFEPAEADGAYEAAARERLLMAVARALCDGELSAEEAEAIEAMEQALDVRVPERVQALLDEAAHRWRVHHGPLPNVDVGVTLRRGETGHFGTDGRWREVNYALLRVLLREHRDRLHRGDTAGLRIPDYALMGRKWREGRIAVTSARLVLVRHREKPKDHGLVSVVGAERYANGVRISIKGGRTFLLDGGAANRTLHAVLWRVLHPGQSLP
jgi:hypothetical protein